MQTNYTNLHVYGQGVRWQRGIRAGVSLHCHTQHSKEWLDFIPHYAARIPVVAQLFHSEMNRYLIVNGRTIDFNRCYWTPFCTARHVYEMEQLQIETRLSLPPLVSLTDHDDISASLQIQALDPIRAARQMPISLEWTVPFQDGFFHLGFTIYRPKRHKPSRRSCLITPHVAQRIANWRTCWSGSMSSLLS